MFSQTPNAWRACALATVLAWATSAPLLGAAPGGRAGATQPAAARVGPTQPAGLAVQVTQNTDQLMPCQVFELTFRQEANYASPLWDVTIEVTFTPPDSASLSAPGGGDLTVGGFFYGSSRPQKPVLRKVSRGGREVQIADWPCEPADLWKARFAPPIRPGAKGRWTYQWVFRDTRGQQARGQGAFDVVKGRVPQHGWLRIDPACPVRLIYEDGTPYFPIGFQDGVFDQNHNGSAMDASGMDGPFGLGRAGALPPGPMFVRGPSMNPQNWDVHFSRHSRAGFNLWRFSPNNFSIKLFARPDDESAESLDHVRWEEARMIDEMLQMTRRYGLRNFYGLFGYTKVFAADANNEVGLAKVRRLLKYSVDRWGAYADIWELLNEQKASDEWLHRMSRYLREIDPYHRPISTSWQRPELACIDINSPHLYENENELDSDGMVARAAATRKAFGKPVIYGEQGNRIDPKKREELLKEGIGGVWDPGSVRRMRVRTWTAAFNDISYVFWETSYARDGHYMNIWIGPEERQYLCALRDLLVRLDANVRPAPMGTAGPRAPDVHAYALRSDRVLAGYFHHVTCDQCARSRLEGNAIEHRWDHKRGAVAGLQVEVNFPRAAQGCWYDPATAAVLKRFDVPAGAAALVAPPFEIDLALLIGAAPPDSDGDGKANDEDEDDDNDGVPDTKDAWPLEREEWADADGDRIGDNLDADIDGDGKADDLNHNGIPDNEEKDWDGDGVPNADAVPWDAFPRDPKEWRDTDADGIGDNTDPDDDGDGYTDEEEKAAGTDRLDPVSFPRG